MRHLRMWALFLVIAQAAAVYGALTEFRLPSLQAGEKVYSNVVVTPSSTDRVLVEHMAGISSVKLAELNTEVLRHLSDAGVVSGPTVKELLRRAPPKPKPEVPKAASAKPESAPVEHHAAASANAKKGSIAYWFLQGLERALEDDKMETDINAVAGRLPRGWGWMALALWLLATLYRRWLFLRIHEAATGDRSWLVFVPLFRVIPLMNAARVSLQWLLVPLFAVVGLFLPPALGHVPWVVLGYYGLIALLWLATWVLYVVWCVRLCTSVERTRWLALLLMSPLFDWIALLVLASSDKKESAIPAGRPSLAI